MCRCGEFHTCKRKKPLLLEWREDMREYYFVFMHKYMQYWISFSVSGIHSIGELMSRAHLRCAQEVKSQYPDLYSKYWEFELTSMVRIK
jgi:hypothetical protein